MERDNSKPSEDWHAIFVKNHPDTILVIDRSLSRAWTVVRLMHPDISEESLTFRTLTAKEIKDLNLNT
jgi:hypothetical protein